LRHFDCREVSAAAAVGGAVAAAAAVGGAVAAAAAWLCGCC